MDGEERIWSWDLSCYSVSILVNAFLEGFQKCEKTWQNVGCFADSRNRRVLPKPLINDRDTRSKYYDGHRIDWDNYEAYLHRSVNLRGGEGYSVRMRTSLQGQDHHISYIKSYINL